jgi:hypothetical protein
MHDDDISECDCERLRGNFTALRSTYQERHGSLLMTIIVMALRRRLRPTLRVFFRYVDLKKKYVGYPSVINFEGQSGSGSQEICDLFARFMERTAIEPWVPSDPGPAYVSDKPPFGSL